MMEIPGEYGSGSGTIVRLSTAFSALTGKAIRVTDIRAKRPSPGLRHQHLEALRAIARLSSARLTGDQIGSKEIEFVPGKVKGGSFDVNIETAGSIGLLTYAVLIPAVHGKVKTVLEVRGGSVASKWSPPLIYMENVLFPVLSRMGVQAGFKVRRHGFYPKGGSEVTVEIEPSKTIKPIVMTEPGEVMEIGGLSVASDSLRDKDVAHRQIRGYQRIIRKKIGVDIKPVYVKSHCPGSVFAVWAKTSKGCILAGDSVGELGKPSEVIGEEAAFKLKEEMEYGSTVGNHLADQLIPFMALAKGKSEIIAPDLTEHVKTNIWLCKKFLGSKFLTKEHGENFRVSCSGR